MTDEELVAIVFEVKDMALELRNVRHQRDRLKEALGNLMGQLADEDEEGLMEHADVVVNARAALEEVGYE